MKSGYLTILPGNLLIKHVKYVALFPQLLNLFFIWLEFLNNSVGAGECQIAHIWNIIDMKFDYDAS